MSKEKQIEELAEKVCEICISHKYCNRDAICPNAKREAEYYYNAGYRKQKQGEWKKLYDKAPRYVCTICNHLFNNKEYKYCPNCGAKMKGGAE